MHTGATGLVVEMTDGTSQANAEFRRNVGFYYVLVDCWGYHAKYGWEPEDSHGIAEFR